MEVGVFVVVAWAGEGVLMVFAKKNYRLQDRGLEYPEILIGGFPT